MEKNWQIKNIDPKQQKQISNALNIHPIVSQLLINRSITDIEEARSFLSADLNTLHDPFLFKDMQKAIDRIKLAQARKEKVLIFGDYDVDGVTSSTLMHQLLKRHQIDVTNHIPHRMDDGYGLNHQIAEVAKSNGISLLITVDCGITAAAEVDTINDCGIDVIIIDHHEPPEIIPKAHAIVNPKQKDCPYPFKELASVGLAAKFIQAMEGRIKPEMLDLVAMGTVADIVPLRGENRVFVKNGLPQIINTQNIGLSALLDVAKIKRNKGIKPFHIGFILGPRINAAGRMDTAHDSLDLFLCEDHILAAKLAKVLDKHNLDRQKMQKDVVQEAMTIVDETMDVEKDKVIVLSKEGWHKGVLGIVASRLTDKYFRPAVVISVIEGMGTASCRSVAGFHLHEALENCSECLEQFGGHEGAAGLTIKAENIDPFRNMINQLAGQIFQEKQLIPILSIDCEIALSSINLNLAEIIDSMEPFGEANSKPVFCTYNAMAKSYGSVLGRDTLKFWVTDGHVSFSAVGFGLAKMKEMIAPGRRIDLAYEIGIDDWNKAPIPQLILKDIKVSKAC